MVVTGAAIAATIPTGESSVNDDFSYAKTTFDLVETGRLIYNGWAAAMLGAQAYWGALFVKLFGATFFALRLSTVVLAVWSAGLLYSLHRRAGLSSGLATFGTLLLTLSPIFIPNACTFMTDVPALFFFLLSVYGCVRLAEVLERLVPVQNEAATRIPARAWLWVGFVVVTGLMGGSVRQTNFIILVLGPALIFWLYRKRFKSPAALLLPLGFVTLFSIATAVGLISWFHAQPYSIHEQLGEGVRQLLQFGTKPSLGGSLLKIGLTFAAVIFPLMCIFPGFWRNAPAGRAPAFHGWAIGLVCLLPVCLLLHRGVKIYGWRWCFPWMDNTFGAYVYLTGTAPRPPGDLPFALPLPVFKIFSVAIYGLLGGSAAYLLLSRSYRRLADLKDWTVWNSPILVLWSAFAAAYMLLLVFKVFVPNSYGIFDRYLLPVMPLATIGILTAYQRPDRKRVPTVAWVPLVLLAGYGVAQTHDYFSQLRARIAITRHLEGLGIARQQIMGGFEYDGWTQLTVAGYYNDQRIVNPPGVYQRPLAPLRFKTIFQLWQLTPVVSPDYVVVLRRHPDLFDTDVPTYAYACWLPPFQREIAVQVTDRGRAQTKALAVGANLNRSD